MSHENVELLRGTYEAFGRGDIAAVMAVFAEDIPWSVPEVLPHGMRARGKEEVGQFFQGLAPHGKTSGSRSTTTWLPATASA